MRRRQQVAIVDEDGATHVHVISSVTTQDGRLPRILAELRVSLLEVRVFDASEEPEGATTPAGGYLTGLAEGGTTAAHVADGAAVHAGGVAEGRLTLWVQGFFFTTK